MGATSRSAKPQSIETPASGRADGIQSWKLRKKRTFTYDQHVSRRPREERLPVKTHSQQIVVVSGDTDMTPAESAGKTQPRGRNLPHREGVQRTVPTEALKRYADWMRHVVTG